MERAEASGPARPTRRRFLAAAGAAAVGGLAGCGSDGSEIKHSSDVFGYGFPYATEDVQLNPWLAASYPWEMYTLLFEVESVQGPGASRRPADVVESVSIDGTRATVEYSDAFTWWNGEPVTARDRWVYERIEAHASAAERPAVELLDEYTLAYEFDRPLAEPIVKSHVLGRAVNTPAWAFEEYADRFESATTSEEREDVAEDLRDRPISLSEAAEMGLGCGPFELVEASMSRLMLEPYEDHPRADAIDVERLWLPVTQSLSFESFVDDGVLDGGRGVVDRLRGSPPAFVDQLAEYRTTGGTKLALDWRNVHLGRRGVRQAILAALPLPDVVETGEMGVPATPQTGMATPPARRWLDESVREDLREYPIEADTDSATASMRAAGYTRDANGDWRDPENRPVEFRLRSPMWRNWRPSAQLIAQSLEDFGFDVDFTQISNTRLVYDVETHNFDALLWPSDGSPFNLYDVTATGASVLGYGVTDSEVETSVNGKPVEVTVPTADGEDRSVNLLALWRRLSGHGDRAGTADAIATFARWWNVALPDIDLATGVSGAWGNTRDFAWDGDAAYRASGPANRPVIHALKRGLVGPA